MGEEHTLLAPRRLIAQGVRLRCLGDLRHDRAAAVGHDDHLVEVTAPVEPRLVRREREVREHVVLRVGHQPRRRPRSCGDAVAGEVEVETSRRRRTSRRHGRRRRARRDRRRSPTSSARHCAHPPPRDRGAAEPARPARRRHRARSATHGTPRRRCTRRAGRSTPDSGRSRRRSRSDAPATAAPPCQQPRHDPSRAGRLATATAPVTVPSRRTAPSGTRSSSPSAPCCPATSRLRRR